MLYNGDNPILRIVGVEHMVWSGGTFQVAPRPYSALAFRIAGSARIQSGGQEYSIQTNDVLYLPQRVGYTAEYTDTQMLVIHFETARDDRQIQVYSFQNGEELYKRFLKARSLWEQKEPGYEVYTLAQLYTVLGMLLERETKTNLPAHFLKAVSLINARYKENGVRVNELCSQAGISPTVFRQLFRKHYQKTPVAYITDLRLDNARSLIAGGLSIENAAYESGFNDPKYFARVVKKRFGCTPRDLKTYGK